MNREVGQTGNNLTASQAIAKGKKATEEYNKLLQLASSSPITQAQINSIISSINDLRDLVSEIVTSGISQKTDYSYNITGALDGTNRTFTLSSLFVTGTTKVFLNGIRRSLIDDYIEIGNTAIQFVDAPHSTDKILVDYITT